MFIYPPGTQAGSHPSRVHEQRAIVVQLGLCLARKLKWCPGPMLEGLNLLLSLLKRLNRDQCHYITGLCL